MDSPERNEVVPPTTDAPVLAPAETETQTPQGYEMTGELWTPSPSTPVTTTNVPVDEDGPTATIFHDDLAADMGVGDDYATQGGVVQDATQDNVAVPVSPDYMPNEATDSLWTPDIQEVQAPDTQEVNAPIDALIEAPTIAPIEAHD